MREIVICWLGFGFFFFFLEEEYSCTERDRAIACSCSEKNGASYQNTIRTNPPLVMRDLLGVLDCVYGMSLAN